MKRFLLHYLFIGPLVVVFFGLLVVYSVTIAPVIYLICACYAAVEAMITNEYQKFRNGLYASAITISALYSCIIVTIWFMLHPLSFDKRISNDNPFIDKHCKVVDEFNKYYSPFRHLPWMREDL